MKEKIRKLFWMKKSVLCIVFLHLFTYKKTLECSEQTLWLHLSQHYIEALDNFEGQI